MSMCAVAHGCYLSRSEGTEHTVDAFEVHVTVVGTAAAEPAFRAACRKAGVKALIIDLGAGVERQPMTCSRITGQAALAYAEAARVTAVLGEHGLTVTRVKIEAAPWNADLPVTGYYEHHARVALSGTGVDEAQLRSVCGRLGVHVSRNPFRRSADGSQERFVTLRHPPTSPPEAAERARALWDALRASGFAISRVITEFCIYDSNRALDAAWEGSR